MTNKKNIISQKRSANQTTEKYHLQLEMIIDNRIIVIKKVTNINELLTKGNLSVLLVRMEGRIAFMENNVESDLLYESEVLLLDISKKENQPIKEISVLRAQHVTTAKVSN